MTAAEAFKKWMIENELTDLRGEVIGYQETTVGITIWLKTATGITGIPYPYKYDGSGQLLAW